MGLYLPGNISCNKKYRLLMAGGRFIIAGLVLYSWCRFRRSYPDIKSIGNIRLAEYCSFHRQLRPGLGRTIPANRFAAIIIATVPLCL